MAAKMLEKEELKKLFLDDAAFNHNWSESDSEGYDGDTEEFLDHFRNNVRLKSVNNGANDAFQTSSGNKNELNETNSGNSELADTGIRSQNLTVKTIKSITDCFSLFMDERILTLMVIFTNSKLAKIRKNYSRSRDCQDTNVNEIKVFIGLIILAGLLQCHMKIDALWEKGGLGVEVFRLSMNFTRFKFLLRCVQISNSSESKLKIQIDDSNKNQGIIEVFRKNCQQNYKCGKSIVISRIILTNDLKEMHSKQNSSVGVVIYYAMDTNSCYISELEFYNKNFFDDSNDNCTIHEDAISYLLTVVSKEMNVVLDDSCKPLVSDVIEVENIQKVDIHDVTEVTTEKIVNIYSLMGRTRKLILKLWFYLIDVACLNSFSFYHQRINNNISRSEFLKRLGLDLVCDKIKERSTCQYLPRELRNEAADFLSIKSVLKTFNKNINKPVRCIICPRKADKKVRSYCHECERPMCQSHMTSTCDDCINI